MAAQETSLTIYSDGRVLVRRTVPASVPRGTSILAVDLGVRVVEPGSIVALDEGVQVSGSRLAGATGMEGSLRRALGSEVLFRVGSDSAPRYLRGTLLSVDPPAVRLDGYVLYGLPGQPVFHDSLVQLQPRVELSIDAARPQNGLRLMFLSSGLAWGAHYAVLVPRGGSGQASVSGSAVIANTGGVSLAGAQVQLLAGDVRQDERPSPRGMMRLDAVVVTATESQEEAVGGTHVYALPGNFDFVPGETRTLALFPRTTAAVEPEFVLRAVGYGVIAPWPESQRDLHPDITYLVRRPAGPAATFGATPLPGGVVRVFEPDSAGRPQLLGEVNIGHTPAGRDLRLTTGTAFDITATKTQTAYERRGERAAASAYRVELRNAGGRAVTVVVQDVCPGECDIESSSIRGEKPSAQSLTFRVPVPAGGSATLDYRIRARW